ncbi:hypothetical protein [uncultured Gammaproteobacteria bacterium]|nr:hypothetical protein [uncultured Gammaproteobacteria bacterium]
MQKILPIVTLVASLNANAVLGPIPIYLNTEYRTDSPVIGPIASALSFSAQDIKATGASTFLDFLATIPSVNLFNPQGNVPAVFIRGNKSEHTLFIVDGVSIVSANSLNGAVEYGLTNIPINDIEKVEIIKNSGSVLYGSGAIAGVISITTKKGANGTSAVVSTKFGTNNSKTYTLSANSNNKNGFIRFTHSKYTTDGINSQTKDTTGEKDSIKNQSTQIKVGNKRFDVSYLKARDKTEYDSFNGTNNGELADTKFTKTMLNTNKTFSKNWKSKLSISQIKNNGNNGINATIIGDKYKSTNITLLNDIKTDNALFNVGLSKTDDKNTTKNKKLSSKELFINWQKNINSIDVNAGTRYTHHSKFGNKTIYRLSTAKYLDNNIKLTANYNTGFKAPTLKNLYGWDFSGNKSSTGANLNLKPETSKNIEVGIEKQYDSSTIRIALYKNKIKNLITTTGTWGTSDYSYVNINKLITKGLELSVNTDISGYNVDFSHGYNNSKENNNTIQSIKRPKNTSNLTISKRYAKFNSRIQIIRKSSSLDFGNVKLEGYTLVNLSSRYDINDKTKISININNAFDKDYTVANGYNQLGRTFNLGLGYQF